MAAPVSHIVYAKKYLEKFPMNEIDRDLFLLGCSFPDIRRVDDSIGRGETHLRFFPLNLNFKNLSPFEAGWKFHLYCDMRREEILRDGKFYDLKKEKSNKWLHPAKFLEDQMLYDKYNNWEKLVGFFNNPPKVETGLNVSRESFGLWYAMLARYLEKKPDQRSTHIFLVKQHGLPDKVDNITKIMEKIKENEKAVKFLENVINEIV